MKCQDKKCNSREQNGGDDKHDYYFCKCCGIGLRDDEECFLDKFEQEESTDSTKV